MQTYELTPHPTFAPKSASKLTVGWKVLDDRRLMLRYRVLGCADLSLPEDKNALRGEKLWEKTCFEVFLYDGEGRYREFNFSPSRQWAAYRFHGYRSQREDFNPRRNPEILVERGQELFMLTAFISAKELVGASSAALSAVLIEEKDRPSYWAMAHGGLKPDFHDPACFKLRLL